MNLLNISAIYELEVGKFMANLQNKQLPDYFNSLFSLNLHFIRILLVVWLMKNFFLIEVI